MAQKKKLFKVVAHGRGVFYRYATNAVAAKNRIVFQEFGRGYTGWEHDYWDVTEVEKTK